MALPPTTPNSTARRINFEEDNTQKNTNPSNIAWNNPDLLSEDTTDPTPVKSLADRVSRFKLPTTRQILFRNTALIDWSSCQDESSEDLEKRLSPPSKKTKAADDTPKVDMPIEFSTTCISTPSFNPITPVALSALSTPPQVESMELDGYWDGCEMQENDSQITRRPPKVKKVVPPTPRKRENTIGLEFSEISSPFFPEGWASSSNPQQQNIPSAPGRKGWSRRLLEPVKMEFTATEKIVTEGKIPTEVVVEEKPQLTPEEQEKADWEALIPIRRIKKEYIPQKGSKTLLTKLVWGKNKEQSAYIDYLNKGDFQEVWKIQDQSSQSGQHLVIKTFLAERKDHSCTTELENLLLAYEQIYGGAISGFSINDSGEAVIEGIRLAKWLNRETAKEEGVSIYELVEGERATYKDVLPYLRAVASDPESCLIMDFMPWNVIVTAAKEPVLVDLRARGPEWNNVNWNEITDSVEWKTATGAWESRIYHMCNLFSKWLKDKKPWVSEAMRFEFQKAFEDVKFKSVEIQKFFEHILSLVTT